MTRLWSVSEPIAERLYRYDCIGSSQAGEHRHPQVVIRELAPDANCMEGVPIGDCWLFCARPIAKLPNYVADAGSADDYRQRNGITKSQVASEKLSLQLNNALHDPAVPLEEVAALLRNAGTDEFSVAAMLDVARRIRIRSR